jgi:hypothetical protein
MNNELKEHSFILEPDGKIYLKDGDNAVEVSNQKEILMHWKFPTANMIEGIPFTVGYCSVEERTTTECKMPHRSMCYTNCDCVAKLVALVTFPESGEKKQNYICLNCKAVHNWLPEECPCCGRKSFHKTWTGEKQSQEETQEHLWKEMQDLYRSVRDMHGIQYVTPALMSKFTITRK